MTRGVWHSANPKKGKQLQRQFRWLTYFLPPQRGKWHKLCKSFSHPFWVTIYPQIHNIHQVWTSSVIQNFCLHSIFFISLSVHLSSSFKILLHRYPSDQPRQPPPKPPNCWDCGVDGLTPQRPCRRRRRHAAQASSPHGDPYRMPVMLHGKVPILLDIKYGDINMF